MPKAFSTDEREQIRLRLLAAGKKLINAAGVRKLSVDDATSLAGISKGSFYNFFPSREDFILSVFEEWENQYRSTFLAQMEDASLEPRLRWERFFLDMVNLMEREPGLALMRSADVELLMARLPAERLEQHQQRDQQVLGEAMGRWMAQGVVIPAAAALLPGLVAMVFSIALHRHDFGDLDFGATMNFLAAALAKKMTGGDE